MHRSFTDTYRIVPKRSRCNIYNYVHLLPSLTSLIEFCPMHDTWYTWQQQSHSPSACQRDLWRRWRTYCKCEFDRYAFLLKLFIGNTTFNQVDWAERSKKKRWHIDKQYSDLFFFYIFHYISWTGGLGQNRRQKRQTNTSQLRCLPL